MNNKRKWIIRHVSGKPDEVRKRAAQTGAYRRDARRQQHGGKEHARVAEMNITRGNRNPEKRGQHEDHGGKNAGRD